MSYLVLARKWRPQRFEDVVGQQHVLRALSHALESDKLHHAYLFAGTRGVGKTTLARILAKAMNCERGVSATPCGVCSACTEIDEGRFVDLIEVDAASRTKVDDMREMLDNVQYRPTRGRKKVYLIDEVHMLSTHSFNALLKTLEEPPEHVTFLLATTDPQKLPVTVLSRCLQFNLKRLTPQLIADRMAFIAKEEGLEADDPSLSMIARAADGSMRDALSIMDQAIAYGGGRLEGDAVASMLGALDRNAVARIVDCLADGDAQGLLDLIEDADAQFPDYGRLLDELAGLLTRVAVFQATGAGDADAAVAAEVERLAGRISPEDAQLYYQFAVVGKRDLYLAPDPRSGVEMTLLRMLAFRPGAPATAPAPAAAPAPGAASGGKSAAPKASQHRVAEPAAPAAPSAAPAPKPVARSADEAATGLEDWHRLVGQLPLSGVARLLAANCAFTGREDGLVRLSLDRRSESMLKPERVAELESALSDYLGDAITVRVEIDGQAAGETPTQRVAREAAEAQAATRDELDSDAGVAAIKNMFDAELVERNGEP
ncbi:MAG: DNA polymerase III subunit gamma/tau [Pseudomonadota bacterium]